jgi:hypothetical protein
MNTRKRIISPANALFVGPSPASGVHTGVVNPINQLHRVQSASWGFQVNRQDVNQFGQLEAIDRVSTESPTVNLEFSYLVTDAANEEKMGFTIGAVSVLSGVLAGTEDEKNYFLLNVPEGNNAAGFAAGSGTVIGIGNGFLARYSLEGAVGGFPTASVSVEALNIAGYLSGTAQPIPAVDPQNGLQIGGVVYNLPQAVSGEVGQITAIQPGDITLDLDNGALFVQSFSVGFDLSREPIQALGYKFTRSRELQFPINVTLTTEVLAGDLVTGNLANILCADTDYDMVIQMREPNCAGTGDIALRLDIKGAKLDGQNWQANIGSNQTVSLNWVAQISGPQNVEQGLFMSGKVEADY